MADFIYVSLELWTDNKFNFLTSNVGRKSGWRRVKPFELIDETTKSINKPLFLNPKVCNTFGLPKYKPHCYKLVTMVALKFSQISMVALKLNSLSSKHEHVVLREKYSKIMYNVKKNEFFKKIVLKQCI